VIAATPARLVRRHVLPGRLRLYVPAMRRDARHCRDLVEAATKLPGVQTATGCVLTGTLLIRYDPARLTPDRVETALAARLGPPSLDLATSPEADGPLIHQFVDASLEILAPPIALAALLLRRMRGRSPQLSQPSRKGVGARGGGEMPRWHALSPTDVATGYATDPAAGLDPAEARRRLARYGPNALSEQKPRSFTAVALGQFASVVTFALLGAGVVTSLLGHVRDGVVIAGVLVVNALLGALQDFQADRSLRALRALSAPRARVVRGGTVWEIPAEEVVPGDVLLLREGDGIPADARILRARSLESDESTLTGESLPIPKSALAVPAGTPLAERASMVYRGASVVGGRGRAVVVATGMETEMGRITRLLGQAEDLASPLQARMERLVRVLLAGSALLGGAISAAGLLRGQPLVPMLLTGISMAIAAVPEGLPIFVTVAQAAAVRRMARRQMLVRRLSALETLARASVVCCDKTGTLTNNELHLRSLTDGETLWRADPAPDGSLLFTQEGRRVVPRNTPGLCHLLARGALSTSSRLVNGHADGANGRLIQGSRTGAAFLLAAEAAGLDLGEILDRYEKVAEAPFDTARRDNRLLYRDPEGGYLLVVKGAPEAVLPLCRWRASGAGPSVASGEDPLTEEERQAVQIRAEEFARDALRVLALGCRRLDEPLSDAELELLEPELALAGLVGLMDAPRSDVSDAIARLRAAGVRVAMITGDHPETARAVAGELRLAPRQGRVLTGPEIDAMADAALIQAAREVDVYARVTPEHKLRIVAALRRAGECVAMTGDGVNDAPAVRLADVGICMGGRGAEVTRQAASLVITDDRFPTLLGALAEGRGIQRNLRRGLGFLLGGNVGETLFVGAAVAAGLPMPLLTGQILLLNLLSDALPILAIVAQPPTGGALRARSNADRENVVAPDLYRETALRGGITGLTTLAAFATALRRSSGDLAHARSVGFAALVGQQLLQIGCESLAGRDAVLPGEGRRVLVGALVLSFAMLGASLHLPLMQRLFLLAPLGPRGWALAAQASVVGAAVLAASAPRMQEAYRNRDRAIGAQDAPERWGEGVTGRNGTSSPVAPSLPLPITPSASDVRRTCDVEPA
jgi:Ca2+-transporting ATPase